MTRSVLQDRPPFLQQHSCHETFNKFQQAFWYQTVLSSVSRDLLVSEDHPAANEPSQEEVWLTRLRARVALRKPQRYVESCQHLFLEEIVNCSVQKKKYREM